MLLTSVRGAGPSHNPTNITNVWTMAEVSGKYILTNYKLNSNWNRSGHSSSSDEFPQHISMTAGLWSQNTRS